MLGPDSITVASLVPINHILSQTRLTIKQQAGCGSSAEVTEPLRAFAAMPTPKERTIGTVSGPQAHVAYVRIPLRIAQRVLQREFNTVYYRLSLCPCLLGLDAT